MVDELTHEGRARRVGRVVPVVRAEAEIGDQEHRPLAEIVLRIEQTARLPQLEQRGLDVSRRLRERRQAREAPSERRRARGDGRTSSRLRREGSGEASRHRDRARTDAGPPQESAPAIARARRLFLGRAHLLLLSPPGLMPMAVLIDRMATKRTTMIRKWKRGFPTSLPGRGRRRQGPASAACL